MATRVQLQNLFLSKKLGNFVRYNSNRASVAKIGREIYTKMYPTTLIYPNGATITIRYHEPIKIIKLPFDLNSIPEDEKALRLQMKKPKTKIVVEEEIEDDFDVNKYVKLTKKQ